MLHEIPRTMSTQHPDNARFAPWCKKEVLEGDDEVREAFYAYKELGCHEVMWDSEGKDVDTRVVRKFLSYYDDYFREHVIGRDLYLTYRIPNPRLDRTEKKIILETLENIVVSHDVATAFYGFETSPIFEVIHPMTTEAKELLCLSEYYRKVVAGVDKIKLCDMTVAEWLGILSPKNINVIPLVENALALTSVDFIVEPYLRSVKPEYLRVFIARSDPALNYGMLSSILQSKIALSKLATIESKTQKPIYPIIGVGSMPFRGHLSPKNVQGFLDEYKGIHTVTIQSALKYDYPLEETKTLIHTINNKLPYKEINTMENDEKTVLDLISKTTQSYQQVIEPLAPLINSVASIVPPRRARKLHVGLFGYSRMVGGVQLPRAIPFTCALYSLGLPPEFIGLRVISEFAEEEWRILNRHYLNMEADLKRVSPLTSLQCLSMLKEESKKVAARANTSRERLLNSLDMLQNDIKVTEENLGIKIGSKNLSQRKYENNVCNFLISYIEDDKDAQKHMVEAAMLRKCLG